MPGPMEKTNGRAGTGLGDVMLGENGGNTFPEPTARPSGDSTAGDDVSPVADGTGFESDVAGGDTLPVCPSHPLLSSLVLMLFPGCSTLSPQKYQCCTRIDAPPRYSKDGKISINDGFLPLILAQAGDAENTLVAKHMPYIEGDAGWG